MARSSSRDVVDRFAGNRGYFHRAEPLRRWKNLAAIGAAFLTLGWLVVEFVLPGRAANAHSHGELANPHAAFDSDCQACHKGHSAGEFFSNPLSAFGARSRWRDLTCVKCHAGPSHHENAKDQSFHNQCSNCHHDHNGRNFSLVKMDDSHCTKCHENLAPTHATGNTRFANTITSFATDHPEFRSLKIERGLKFSHGLHMTPGLVYGANDQNKWTPESLGQQFGSDARDRFASATGDPNDPVQLNCNSCHVLDSGRPAPQDTEANRLFDLKLKTIPGASRNSILPSRSSGEYYQPVNFDVACKVCHPIRSPSTASGGVAIKDFNIPHRRQTNALRQVIRGELANRLASDKNPLLAAPLGPGGRLDPAMNPELGTFGKELDRLTEASLQAVGVACGKCHHSPAAVKTDVLPLPDKSIWFEHASFNHVSHRGLTCAACHPGTEASFSLNEREPPLIAGVKSCQTCHAPANAGGAGIRHSCVDCHKYHNGDRPRQGLGSPRRDPKDPLSVDQFLRGGKDQP